MFQILPPDLSLNSWLQSLDAFSYARPFELCELDLKICPLNRPTLESSLWADHILNQPTVKPLVFPYTHIPVLMNSSVHRSTMFSRNPMLKRDRLEGPGGELMRSLIPAYEGLSSGLTSTSLHQDQMNRFGLSKQIIQGTGLPTISKRAVGFFLKRMIMI